MEGGTFTVGTLARALMWCSLYSGQWRTGVHLVVEHLACTYKALCVLFWSTSMLLFFQGLPAQFYHMSHPMPPDEGQTISKHVSGVL